MSEINTIKSRMTAINKQLAATVSIIVLILSSCTQNSVDPVGYVNPYIGNISHLLVPTYPTVHIPNSMVRFYPERDNFTSNKMQGFPLNVVSHRDGKAFSLVPFTGNGEDLTGMSFTFDNETITPYSYSVTLDESDIDVKFAPAEKSGFFSFRFNGNENNGIILRTTGLGELTFENGSVTGHDTNNGVKSCLCLEFDKMPDKISTRKNDTISQESSVNGRRVAIIASFKSVASELNIRYGLSYISSDQARKNLHDNIGNRSFGEISDNARNKWNALLSKIEVEGGTPKPADCILHVTLQVQ